MVVLATPWSAAEAALKEADDLRGKAVVDATIPLKPDLSSLAPRHSTSAGERVAGGTPCAKVVKAFNTIGAAHPADPRFGTECASMFLGGDTGANAMRARLSGELGFDPVDGGPLTPAPARTARDALDLDGLPARGGPE